MQGRYGRRIMSRSVLNVDSPHGTTHFGPDNGLAAVVCIKADSPSIDMNVNGLSHPLVTVLYTNTLLSASRKFKYL